MTNPCFGIKGLIKNEEDPTHKVILRSHVLPTSVVLMYANILENCQFGYLFFSGHLLVILLYLTALHNIFVSFLWDDEPRMGRKCLALQRCRKVRWGICPWWESRLTNQDVWQEARQVGTRVREVLSKQWHALRWGVVMCPVAGNPAPGCSGFTGRVAHSLGPSLRSREGLRAVVPHLGKGRGKGPHELRSTRSISSSPSWFSALSPVSQGLRALPGTLVGEMPPQLALLPPDSVELHGTCLPAAGSHILHWKTQRGRKESKFKSAHTDVASPSVQLTWKACALRSGPRCSGSRSACDLEELVPPRWSASFSLVELASVVPSSWACYTKFKRST